MRASSPGIKAIAVWDVLVTAITTVGSIGELLDDIILFETYSHNENAMAAGAEYIPAARTIPMTVALSVAQKLNIQLSAHIIKAGADLGATEKGYFGPIWCDGAATKFKNTDAGAQDLFLRGVTI